MLDVTISLPPIIHGTAMTSSDVVTFWVTVGVIVALVVGAAIILGLAGYQSVRRQSQMKGAEQPKGEEQPPVRTLVRLPSLT